MTAGLFQSVDPQLFVALLLLTALYLARKKNLETISALLALVALIDILFVAPLFPPRGPLTAYRVAMLVVGVFSCALLVWERLSPRHKGFWSSPQMFKNVVYIYIVLLLTSPFYRYIGYPIRSFIPGLLAMDQYVPLWLQFPIWFLITDLFLYSLHWALHHFDFAWRFHKVHHSAEQLNVFVMYYNSPVEHFAGLAISAVLMGVFSPSPETFFVTGFYYLFKGPLAHANLDFPRLGGKLPFWAYIITTPNVHAHHHTIEGMRSNYGTGLMIWDWLFGTLQIPEQVPNVFSNGDKNDKPRTMVI